MQHRADKETEKSNVIQLDSYQKKEFKSIIIFHYLNAMPESKLTELLLYHSYTTSLFV